MHLLRCLAFYSAFIASSLKPHTYQALRILQQMPYHAISSLSLSLSSHIANSRPCIEQSIIDLLVSVKPDWGSQIWTHLLRNSLRRASLPPLEQSIGQAGTTTTRSATNTIYPPLPVTEHRQIRFASHLSQSVSSSTIHSYLSAVRFFQIRAGLSDPSKTPAFCVGYFTFLW